MELEEIYYVELPAEREEHIAALAGCSVWTAQEWLYADWPEGAEHFDWLKQASDEEIADWLHNCLQQ